MLLRRPESPVEHASWPWGACLLALGACLLALGACLLVLGDCLLALGSMPPGPVKHASWPWGACLLALGSMPPGPGKRASWPWGACLLALGSMPPGPGKRTSWPWGACLLALGNMPPGLRLCPDIIATCNFLKMFAYSFENAITRSNVRVTYTYVFLKCGSTPPSHQISLTRLTYSTHGKSLGPRTFFFLIGHNFSGIPSKQRV